MKFFCALWLAAPMFACQIVAGDRILAKDLAAANPIFAQLDPAMVIGAAPLAGVRRVWRAEESVRLAKQNGIAVDSPFGDVCFERVVETLTAEKLLPALQAAVPGASIEILDFSKYAVPAGTLEFKRDGLTPGGFWRGRVVYGEGRSASVWARVQIVVEQSWVEAVETLAPGRVIEAAQLTMRQGQRAPFSALPADSIEKAAGRKTTRTIRPGEPILASMLIAPFDVDKGDNVTVQVASGQARLSFEAVADTAGRAGGTVQIKNPENGRRFQARVEGKGKVSVTK